MIESGLADLAQSVTPPFAYCGIAVAGTGVNETCVSTAPGIAATDQTVFRAASISKIVTGMALRQLGRQVGLNPPYGQDAGAILGYRLRHPDHPDLPITVGMLAAHTSGLTDHDGYSVPPDMTLRDWLASHRPFGHAAPGTRFTYCNLGYIVLAAVIEVLSGQQFDLFARERVLDPLGIDAGFNWSGVADRRDRIATYRRDPQGLHPQIDAQVAEHGVTLPDGRPLDLSDYIPGQNPGVFGPQGALRISLAGALRLAQAIPDALPTLLWSGDGPGDYEDGVFDGYGEGLQILRNPRFYPRPLIGHFANAYGFIGGVWWDAQAQVALAYGLNGLEVGDESDALHPEEVAIFSAIAGIVG